MRKLTHFQFYVTGKMLFVYVNLWCLCYNIFIIYCLVTLPVLQVTLVARNYNCLSPAKGFLKKLCAFHPLEYLIIMLDF